MVELRRSRPLIDPNASVSGAVTATVRDYLIAEINRRNPAGEARMLRDRDDLEQLNFVISSMRK